MNIDISLVHALIAEQFPQYAGLSISEVEKQGHDNTYRLGDERLIRLPTAKSYALKIPLEHKFLPKLTRFLTLDIPTPLEIGCSSVIFSYPFSIYKWLPGKSINLLILEGKDKERVAFDLAKFLKELQGVVSLKGPEPGQHN